jgi:hypothetical protein
MSEAEVNEPEKEKKKERLEQLQRTFIGDDAAFMEKNRTVLTLFAKEQATFQALDPTLDAAFLLAWQNLIETCESHTSDETMLDMQREKTTALEQHINAALLKVNELEFYVKNAFPDNPALWQEFGFKQRKTATDSHSRFLIWLFTMHRVLLDYEATLLAAGMPATFNSGFENTTSACAEAEFEQEYAKRLRLRQTRLRVEQLNRLHSYLQRVQHAAQIIFATNETKRKEYGN